MEFRCVWADFDLISEICSVDQFSDMTNAMDLYFFLYMF
jgi:hypothetical protein